MLYLATESSLQLFCDTVFCTVMQLTDIIGHSMNKILCYFHVALSGKRELSCGIVLHHVFCMLLLDVIEEVIVLLCYIVHEIHQT